MQSCINETNTYVMAQNKYNANTNPEKANHPDSNDHTPTARGRMDRGSVSIKRNQARLRGILMTGAHMSYPKMPLPFVSATGPK